MATSVCLFTAHTPDTGGGSVIIKSLIKHLPQFNIKWNYLADAPTTGTEAKYMGQGIMGSSLIKDVYQTFLMLSNRKVNRIDEIVDELLAIECDVYWVISHNEGLRVAIELAKRQTQRPVHLTVHDDWAGALCARSFRYQFMSHLANKMTIRALNDVNDVDVISYGMQEYYLKISNRKTQICHRYLEIESVGKWNDLYLEDRSALVVGHIGSIYRKEDLVEFLSLISDYGKRNGIKVILNMWGYHGNIEEIPGEYHDIIKLNQHLSEDKAIIELAKCDFVYCMYPQNKKLSIFGKTSLPTKLTTYVQACRPIFGHGPNDCTLAHFLSDTNTGFMWTTNNAKTGLEIIDEIRSSNNDNSNWVNARDNYFGTRNLQVLTEAFSKAQ